MFMRTMKPGVKVDAVKVKSSPVELKIPRFAGAPSIKSPAVMLEMY
jgi:hypothetical protein